MPNFKPKDSDRVIAKIGERQQILLSLSVYERFNSSLLGLGDLTKQAEPTDSVAAVFDLEGFTNFCTKIDPHLSVPLFLREFLEWTMATLKEAMTQSFHHEGVRLWSPLPYFVKFMGDGLLVLWDASETDDIGHRNIVISASEICEGYVGEFLPGIRSKVVDPPLILRCGLARGTTFSVGDGNDYVGSCINMAARIQKLRGTTFVFNRRGFDLESEDRFKESIVIKRFTVRGIGENELVALLKHEYEKMSPDDKAQFRDP